MSAQPWLSSMASLPAQAMSQTPEAIGQEHPMMSCKLQVPTKAAFGLLNAPAVAGATDTAGKQQQRMLQSLHGQARLQLLAVV